MQRLACTAAQLFRPVCCKGLPSPSTKTLWFDQTHKALLRASGAEYCAASFQGKWSRCYSKDQSQTEDMEHLKSNPNYAKYAEKIKKMQESAPEQFQSKLDELEQAKQKEKEEREEQLREAEAKMKEKRAQQSKPKSLDDVMKLELLQDKTPEEITQIWIDYHTKKDCIFAVLQKPEYEDIHRKSLEFSTFLYPLPRDGGYEFFLQQFEGHDCHFTPLLMYQAHKENAPASLTITHYTELMEDKGIVLMHGYPDTTYLSQHEAQLLALQLKMYYGMQSGLKFNLVRLFKHDPDRFKHNDLITEFENYKKDALQKKLYDFGTAL